MLPSGVEANSLVLSCLSSFWSQTISPVLEVDTVFFKVESSELDETSGFLKVESLVEVLVRDGLPGVFEVEPSVLEGMLEPDSCGLWFLEIGLSRLGSGLDVAIIIALCLKTLARIPCSSIVSKTIKVF